MSKNKRFIFWLCLIMSAVVGVCLTSELFLHLLWNNPFDVVWYNYNEYINFLQPHQRAIYDIAGLYPHADKALFRTGRHGEVLKVERWNAKRVFAFGGSTTESRYVTEGKRWPELLESLDVENFGVSGNALGDTYFNLKFLIGHNNELPDGIMIMHGVNDINSRSHFINFCENSWKLNGTQEKTNKFTRWSRVARKLYLVAFIMRNYELWKSLGQEDHLVVNGYLSSKKRNDKGPEKLSKKEFEEFTAEEMRFFLVGREILIRELIFLTEKNVIDTVFITQPCAYREDYKPYLGRDLREFPIVNGRNLTIRQTAQIFQLVNDHTRKTAVKYGAGVIDAASFFDTQDPSELFYDSVHFTEQGSKVFADFLNRQLS